MRNNNFTKSLLKRLTIGLSVVLATFVIGGSTASAIPYNGNNTTTSPVPAFNVFTGVPGVGTEADFLRARVPTVEGDSATPYVDPLNASCVAGQKIQMRVYVHNGASVNGNNNGSGPSVAHGTKVKVALPGNEAASFTPRATISANNAATVNDNVTINCNGKKVKLKYVNGSAKQFSLATGFTAVNDSIVTTGAPIHSNGVSGDVWGCFDQRVYVLLTAQVQETPPPPPVSTGVCKLLSLSILNKDEREVRASLSGEVNNATITGYKIDFGDGASSNQSTATHKYAKDGTYTVTGYVTIKFADGHSETKTAPACAKPVKFVPKDCVNNPNTPEDECSTCVDNPNTPVNECKPCEDNMNTPENECKPCEDNMNTPENECKPETPPVTPSNPGILPNTGPGAVVATFVGVSSLSSGLYYLVRRKFGL